MSEITLNESAEAPVTEDLIEWQTTSVWLYNQRDVEILNLKNQIENESDITKRVALITQLFNKQCAQVEGGDVKKMRALFARVRGGSLPEAKDIADREKNTKLRAVFETYVNCYHQMRLVDDGELQKRIFENPLFRNGMEIAQLDSAFKEEKEVEKKMVLLNEKILRQLRGLTPELKAVLKAVVSFIARQNSNSSEIPFTEVPKELEKLAKTYLQIRNQGKVLQGRALLQLIRCGLNGSESPKIPLPFLKIYKMEKKEGSESFGKLLLLHDLLHLNDLALFAQVLLGRDEKIREKVMSYLKEGQETLSLYRDQLREVDQKLLDRILNLADSKRGEPTVGSMLGDLLMVYAKDGILDKDTFKWERRFCLTGVKAVCAAAKVIGQENKEDAKRIIENLKTYVDKNIYVGWFNQLKWLEDLKIALLEIGQALHQLDFPDDQKLNEEINKDMRCLGYEKRKQICQHYGYEYLFKEWDQTY